MYVSYKRQRNNDYRFGFIRFKKMEEARNSVRNLNAVKIRGNSLRFLLLNLTGKACLGLVLFCRRKITIPKKWR